MYKVFMFGNLEFLNNVID